jgi:hypothetical protein
MLIATISAVFGGARGGGRHVRCEVLGASRDEVKVQVKVKGRNTGRVACLRRAYATDLPIFFLQLVLQEIFYQGLYALGEEFLEMGA